VALIAHNIVPANSLILSNRSFGKVTTTDRDGLSGFSYGQNNRECAASTKPGAKPEATVVLRRDLWADLA